MKAGGGHGVFFNFVLEGLRGKAVNSQGKVTWDRLVTYVRESVDEEFGRLVPEAPAKQRPHDVRNLDTTPVLIDTPAAGRPSNVFELALGNGVKMKFVRIPAAGRTFWMGSPPEEKDRYNDEDQVEVEFSLDNETAATETTQAQYVAISGKPNPSYFRKDGEGKAKVQGLDTDDFPVENVSWDDATAFGEALTRKFAREVGQKFGATECLFRLPTEAEWEYACRGGASKKNSLPFHMEDGPTASLSSRQANYPYGNAAKGP